MANLREGAWINATDGRFAYIDEHANWAKRPGNLASIGLADSAWEAVRNIPNDYSGDCRKEILVKVMAFGGIRMRGHRDFITFEFTEDWASVLRACRAVLREIAGEYTPCRFNNLAACESLEVCYGDYEKHIEAEADWILGKRKRSGRTSKFLSNKRGMILPKMADSFEGLYRSGDRLKVEVRGSATRLAKAGLIRLLTHFKSNVDFLIFTPYRMQHEGETSKQTNDINDANFRALPQMLRKTLGTSEIGAFELWVHWSKRADGRTFEVLARSWVFINGDPKKISQRAFLEAAQALGRQFEQSRFIIRLNGVCTLELTRGLATELTTGEAIEHALAKVMQETGEFERWEVVKEGDLKTPGSEYPVLIRESSPEEFAPESFVSVPGSMGDMKYLAHHGIDHPGWPW